MQLQGSAESLPLSSLRIKSLKVWFIILFVRTYESWSVDPRYSCRIFLPYILLKLPPFDDFSVHWDTSKQFTYWLIPFCWSENLYIENLNHLSFDQFSNNITYLLIHSPIMILPCYPFWDVPRSAVLSYSALLYSNPLMLFSTVSCSLVGLAEREVRPSKGFTDSKR